MVSIVKAHPVKLISLATIACLLSACETESPQSKGPVVAGIIGLPLTLVGEGIEEASGVTLEEQPLTIDAIESGRLTVTLPDTATSGELVVQTPSKTLLMSLEVYDYTSIAMPETPGTNAHPLAIDIDSSQNVWINQEFHLAFHRVRIENGEAVVDPFVVPVPTEGPFATTLFGDRPTATSTLGEDVEVDDDQNIWFTQGGGSLYQGAFENHSRVVRFVPEGDAGRFDVFNIPGDHNEIIGIAIDGQDVWVAQGNPQESALWRFRPDTLAADDGTFDFSESLDSQVCDGVSVDGCFQKFVMPTINAHPAHLVVDDDGWVWVTEYFRTAISALNPATGEFKRYPQAASDEQSHALLGAGPWEIFIDDADKIVFNSYFDNTITWFDRSRRDDPACLMLDAEGENPCSERLRVEDEIELAQVHSITKGDNGRVWFTTAAGPDESVPTSVGFVTADRSVVRLPQLSLVPGGGGGQNGIVRDSGSGDLWFTEFFSQSVGRLEIR